MGKNNKKTIKIKIAKKEIKKGKNKKIRKNY